MGGSTGENSEMGGRLVVDCIYSSAIEPGRFEYLVESWDRQLRDAGYSSEALSLFSEKGLAAHVDRAQGIAARVSSASRGTAAEIAVNQIQTAAFVCSRAGRIVAANAAALSAFGAAPGMSLSYLPVSAESAGRLSRSIEEVASARDARQELLRLSSKSPGRSFFTLVRAIAGEDGQKLALTVTTEHVWQARVEAALQKAFAFTGAENEVLRLILSGVSVAEIASLLARTESTIRSHIHSLLAKTGTRSQAELLTLTLAFQEPAGEASLLATGPVLTLRANPFETLILPDGRRLDYLRLGDPAGRPFIWLHGTLSQCRLPRAAEAWLNERRLAMVVPVRAGYGYSSPLPPKRDPIAIGVADISILRNRLCIGPGPVVAHGNDFLLATALANYDSAAVTRIIGVGAAFPIETREDYARLGIWARFFRANARYAPNMVTLLGRGVRAYIGAVGFEAYAEKVLRGTVDADALRDPEIRAAVIAGSEVVFSPSVDPSEAFSADMLAVHRDWRPNLTSLKVPVTLFHGEGDPNCPFETAAAHCRANPSWRISAFKGAGSFVHHAHWLPLVEMIEAELAER
jgi:pimeloyl-ACP methyl ester carboxylesterase/DNA-binding CsgD family transcriptional regulator